MPRKCCIGPKKWFKGTRKEFEIAFYGFLGIFKMLVIILNLVPFLALSIMG